MDKQNRERFGKGGLGIDLMTGVALMAWPHAWWGILFGAGTMLALWGYAPALSDRILRHQKGTWGKHMLANIIMVIGIAVFAAGAIWSAAMAGAADTSSKAEHPAPVAPSINQHGAQNAGGNITMTGPVFNGPVSVSIRSTASTLALSRRLWAA